MIKQYLIKNNVKPNPIQKGLGFFVFLFSFLFIVIFGITPDQADSSLVGWWTFNDGTGANATDSSQYGNNGTLSSPSPTWVAGDGETDESHALSFDGSNDYVSIPSSNSINSIAGTNQEVTVSVWINISASTPINIWQPIVTMNNWSLMMTADNLLTFTTSNSYYETNNGFPFKPDGKWHMITATFNGTTDSMIRIYQDGVLMRSYYGGALSSSSLNLFIGEGSGNNSWEKFQGSMDDVRIYNRALSASDIAQLYGKTPVSLSSDQVTYPSSSVNATLTANVYPATGVTVNTVSFYSNNTLIGQGQNTQNSPNTYTLSYPFSTGVYALTAVVTDSNSTSNTSVPENIYVNTNQLLYTVNNYGLQSLIYNGRQFVTESPNPGTVAVTRVTFKGTDGTLKNYGYGYSSPNTAQSIGNASLSSFSYSNDSNSASDCSNLLGVTVSGTNPSCVRQKYTGEGTGSTDGYTLGLLYTTVDPQTLKIDYYFTNNDGNDTLNQINVQYFMQMHVPDMNATPNYWLQIGGLDVSSEPFAFVAGTWGSLAFFSDDYTRNTQFGAMDTYNPVPRPYINYRFDFQNYSTPGGDDSNTKIDSVLPGQTYHYAVYFRFGLPTDTPQTLIPQTINGTPVAINAFTQTYPNLLNWTDRRPIGFWFTSNAQYATPTNPRGWNPAQNGFDSSSQANFTASVLAESDQIIGRFNSMTPKPQGFIIYDLEGQEILQIFSYVGYPNKLDILAPEMYAVTDQMFAKFRAAGYQPGIVIRPQTFMSGTTLPNTCTFSTTGGGQASDVFVSTNTNAQTSPSSQTSYRGYACLSDAVCGSANKEYTAGTATWDQNDTFCITGTGPTTTPTFPTAGNSTTWTCTDALNRPTYCTASMPSSVCGSAAKAYPFGSISFGQDTFCTGATISSPVSSQINFPNPANYNWSTSWNCVDAYSNSTSCTATLARPICGTDNQYYSSNTGFTGTQCTTGTPGSATFPANGDSKSWSCTDPNLSSNVNYCYASYNTPWAQPGYQLPAYQTLALKDGLDLFSLAIANGNGGSGYQVNDQLKIILPSNPNNYREALVTVSSVNGGAVTGLNITDYGQAYAYQTGTYNLTDVTGSGSGAAISLTSNFPQITAANLANVNAEVTNSTVPSDYNVSVLANLESKVAYAHQRWGIRLYFIDSSVYGAGNLSSWAFNFKIMRQLLKDFPDCLFIPEETTDNELAASARNFSNGLNNASLNIMSTASMMYQNSFYVMRGVDGFYQDYLSELEQSVEDGNIPVYDNMWWTIDTDAEYVYQDSEGSPSIAANLNQLGYDLTVDIIGTGLGTVTGTIPINSGATNNQILNVQEINCPSALCDVLVDQGTQVTLTAVPVSGYTVTWSSNCTPVSNNPNQCAISVNSTQAVTATFNTTPSSTCQYGCVSGDPSPTMYDAYMVANASVGTVSLTSNQKTQAMVSSKAETGPSMYDAYLIAQYAVGDISKFPVQ